MLAVTHTFALFWMCRIYFSPHSTSFLNLDYYVPRYVRHTCSEPAGRHVNKQSQYFTFISISSNLTVANNQTWLPG